MYPGLDFEKPIVELEKKVADLREYSRAHDVDVTHGIELLEITKVCNAEGIRIAKCQLGCFR